jgi:hypothetical protein
MNAHEFTMNYFSFKFNFWLIYGSFLAILVKKTFIPHGIMFIIPISFNPSSDFFP